MLGFLNNELPEWMRTLDTLFGVGGGTLAIISAIFTALGWPIGKVLGSALPPQRDEQRPNRRRKAPRAGFLGTFFTHLILRPDVPLGQDTSKLAQMYFGFIVLAGFYILGQSQPQAPDVPALFHLLPQLAFYALLAMALWLFLATVRLSWKIDFMHRVDEGDDFAPNTPDQERRLQ